MRISPYAGMASCTVVRSSDGTTARCDPVESDQAVNASQAANAAMNATRSLFPMAARSDPGLASLMRRI